MRVAITGATGVLGQVLVFEMMARHARAGESLELLLLGRGKGTASLAKRMHAILLDAGAVYLQGILDPSDITNFIADHVCCLEADLEAEGLGLAPTDCETLVRRPVDLLVHSAALTDLRHDAATAAALQSCNVDSTRRLLEVASRMTLGEFCYIGSAYATGDARGVIHPSAIDLDARFRNAYERTKLEGEQLVRAYGERSGRACRFFRPSVICGQLMESPPGRTSKFDTFYAWPAFLYWLKRRILGRREDLLSAPCTVDLRLTGNLHGGLNIVPVDFAAKAICDVIDSTAPGGSYHVVAPSETAHRLYAQEAVDFLNIDGVRHTHSLPKNLNRHEYIYYRTVDRVFGPYVNGRAPRFDTSSIDPVLRRSGLRCPAITKDSLRTLFEFAAKANFGLP